MHQSRIANQTHLYNIYNPVSNGLCMSPVAMQQAHLYMNHYNALFAQARMNVQNSGFLQANI